MGDPHMSIRNHRSHQPRFAYGFPKKHETVTTWVWNLPSSYEFIDADHGTFPLNHSLQERKSTKAFAAHGRNMCLSLEPSSMLHHSGVLNTIQLHHSVMFWGIVIMILLYSLSKWHMIHMIHMIHSNNDYRHMIHMYLVSTLIVVLESPMEIRLKWDHHGAQAPGTPTRLTLAAASTGGARLTRGHQGWVTWTKVEDTKNLVHILYHNHI
jgi:hypothetical protein